MHLAGRHPGGGGDRDVANFTGGSADDTFVGTADADVATGNGGNDSLFGLGGNDRLDGGDADDILNGGDNNDFLIGGAGSDSLSGGSGDDVLFSYLPGSAPGYIYTNVPLDIYAEADSLNGGDGDDSLFAGYGDSADGGTYATYGDKLFVSFLGAPSGVVADFRLLATGTVSVGGGVFAHFNETAYIEGSNFDDFLAAYTSSGYTSFGPIYGRGGNDHIIAGYYTGGVWGGDGNDLIDLSSAGYGPNTFGEAGDDHIIGGGGYERLEGGDGDDIVEGNYGFDTLYGGAGNDVMDGGSFGDSLFGDAGNDTLYGAGDADLIEGGDGDDILYGDYSLISSAGGLSPASNADTLRGGAGSDTLYGDQGGDTLDGGDGDDLLYGGTGNDSLTGGLGADRIEGGDGDDTGYGGDGDDLILSGTGTDQLSGEAGNDRLYFGSEFGPTDLAAGGSGRDVVILQGNYTLTLSATNLVGIESLSLQSGARTTWGDVANNFYDYNITTNDANLASGEQLIVNGQTLRAGEDFSFDGSAETNGYFLVYGGHGVDTLKGGAGNDAFFFEGDRWGAGDSVDGGAGRDALIISSGSGINHFDFGATALTSIESISLNNRYTTDPTQKPSYELVLANGNVAAGATLIVNGSSLADPGQTVSVDGSAVQGGNLTLFGGFGNDILIGGDGADLFQGGEGVDVLTGGAGADTFRYAGQYDSTSQLPDRILDFASGVDKIDLSRIDADLFTAGDQAFHWIGSGAFTAGGAASAGELRAWQFNGSWYVEGDMDGNGSADLVIQLTIPVAPPLQADFLL
ncbi:MAG: hypothetical protein QOG72_3101 [Sphingomonadales bacterium]|jgi:Ca2+-binding RTX toxin-like protein|nr:hypothetical protein [Sphingomonadales bacterium]